MKKISFSFFVVLLCTAISFAADEVSLRIGTSRIAGSYQLWGTTWSKVITDKVPGIKASIEATGGPAANIKLIEKGINGLGFASVVATYEGWNGLGWAEGTKYRRMRSVFAMYPSYLQLVTLKKSNIRTINDLTGKKVDVGSPGTTPAIAVGYIIKVLGVKPAVTHNDTKVALEALKNGTIDVFARVTGLPNASIMDLALGRDIYIVGFKPEELNKMISKYPYFGSSAIPAKVYKGLDSSIETLAVWAIAICDKDLKDDTVYRITKAAFENQSTFVKAHPDGKYLLPENVKYLNVPLHPGAYKYYKESGQKVPEAMLPK